MSVFMRNDSKLMKYTSWRQFGYKLRSKNMEQMPEVIKYCI